MVEVDTLSSTYTITHDDSLSILHLKGDIIAGKLSSLDKKNEKIEIGLVNNVERMIVGYFTNGILDYSKEHQIYSISEQGKLSAEYYSPSENENDSNILDYEIFHNFKKEGKKQILKGKISINDYLNNDEQSIDDEIGSENVKKDGNFDEAEEKKFVELEDFLSDLAQKTFFLKSQPNSKISAFAANLELHKLRAHRFWIYGTLGMFAGYKTSLLLLTNN